MKKLLILLLLIIQVGISTVLGQISPQKPDLQEFDDFERLEIVNIEEADSSLIKKIDVTYQLANTKLKELEVRQTQNNSIIEAGNKEIASLNEFAKRLHDLVRVYYGGDTSKRAELLAILKLDSYTNDSTLAIIISSRVEEMKLRGTIINELQDKSIAQNMQDEKFCNALIEHWKMVMRGMLIYFSSTTATPTERKNAKQQIEAALTELNRLCRN